MVRGKIGLWRLLRSGGGFFRLEGSAIKSGETRYVETWRRSRAFQARCWDTRVNQAIGLREKQRSFSTAAPEAQESPRCGTSPQEEAQYNCISTLARQDLGLEDVENSLKEVEAVYPAEDPRLGTIYLRMGQLFDLHGAAPEKLSLCGERALKICKEGSMESAMCYQLLATAHHKNDESEKCLEKLKMVFEIIKENGKEDSALKYAADFLHGDALSDMGKYEQALSSFRSGIALQEKLVDQNHSKLGDNYRRVAEALTQLARLEEALEYVEKAVKFHNQHFGENSLAEAADRRLFAVIYKGMNDPAKAIEQNQIVRNILVHNHRDEEARLMDIGIAVCQIGLKQLDEAVKTLKGILADQECGDLIKGLAHVNLAKVCVMKKQNEQAETHAEAAASILKKNKGSNMMVAEGFVELASVFESMEDRETALELLEDASSLYSAIPGQLNAVAGTESQIGMLCYAMKQHEDALPHMQKAAKILETVFGDQHVALGCVLNQIGVVNMDLKNFSVAAEHFQKAKKIYMTSYGADHEDTLAVNHNMVIVYSELNRWDRAIFCQQQIVHEVEQKGDPQRLDVERRMLKKLQHARNHNTL